MQSNRILPDENTFLLIPVPYLLNSVQGWQNSGHFCGECQKSQIRCFIPLFALLAYLWRQVFTLARAAAAILAGKVKWLLRRLYVLKENQFLKINFLSYDVKKHENYDFSGSKLNDIQVSIVPVIPGVSRKKLEWLKTCVNLTKICLRNI